MKIKSYDCYIEEYYNNAGGLCARLRDRKTGLKVGFASNDRLDKMRLLGFMGSAKIAKLKVYAPDSPDYVFVEGRYMKETRDEIILAYDKYLTYIFK